jgi:hypothetical protein
MSDTIVLRGKRALTRTRTRDSTAESRRLDRGRVTPKQIMGGIVSLVIAAAILVVTINAVTNAATVGGLATLNASATDSATIDQRIGNIPNEVSVSPSQGNALVVDETDTVSASAGADNITRGNLSLAVTASLDTATLTAMDAPRTAASVANGTLQLVYNDSHWIAAYDNGTHSATVNTSAPSPSGLTALTTRANATHLTISRNGSATNASALTTSSDPAPLAFDWVGRLDEVRVFNGSINDSAVAQYGSDPIEPLPDEPRTARYLFDRESGGTSPGYFTAGSAQIGGAEIGVGVQPPQMSSGGLLGSGDYSLTEDPFGISIPSGSYLEGQPVVFVDYGSGAVLPFNVVGIFLTLLFLLALSWPLMRVKEAVDL